MQSGLSSSRVFSPSHEESGDEDLSVLPRHTKVIVKGNNRTKSELVGLQGVVKNAVGHGGWHWLVLENGDKIKLQRNALSVVEPPTGNEEDDYGMDDVDSGSDIRGKASLQLSQTVKYTKPCTPASAKSAKPAKSAKSASLNSIMGSQSNELEPRAKPNFSRLPTKALVKYYRHFNLGYCSPNIERKQLLSAVQQHFSSSTVDEEQTIVEFVRSAKKRKTEGARA